MGHEGFSLGSYVTSQYSNGGIIGNPASSTLGRITTKVVRLKAGHVAQVLVDDVIVRELKPRKESWQAERAARKHVAKRLARAL